ncbi:MAG: hypothetical protein CMF31_03405 [Kordiimonas sp.]|nr:hypothetical protein [Kordiimonas sp.]
MMNKKIGLLALAVAMVSGAVFAVPAPAEANDIKSWQGKVVKLISKKQVYPRAALANEIEGKAKVRVSIDRTGAITNYEVVQPTGTDVLDNEVPKLISRINPLPQPPSSLSDEQMTFMLPLSWVIQ